MGTLKRKAPLKAIFLFIFIILVILSIVFLYHFNLLPQKHYTAKHFNIKTIHSSVDFNNNGIDDYTDILLGARADAKNHPRYDGAYYKEGYPPKNIGVCTDAVWRAFKNAGYCLRDMVDNDILNRPQAYPHIEKRDNNIDFRRVTNLHVFFGEYAVSLTTDINDIDQWQPGDIVIFDNDKHIGIVSDKRNRKGQPYILHNAAQPNREEDYLKRSTVTAHFRFDASQIDEKILVKMNDE